MGMRITRVIFRIAGHFGLLKAPLWQNDVVGLQPAPQCLVLEPHASRERMNDIFSIIVEGLFCVFDDVKNPIIVGVTNGIIPVTANFVLNFGYGSRNSMRVEQASRWHVLQTNRRLISEIADFRRIKIESWLLPSWQNIPYVVLVLIVVTCNLLLK